MADLKIAPRLVMSSAHKSPIFTFLFIFAAFYIVSSPAIASSESNTHTSPPLVIQGIEVIDVKNSVVRTNQTVVIAGDRILSMGEALTIPQDATVIQGEGKYLIPGLWDMHVHLEWGLDKTIPLFPANGVTAIREMGGTPEMLKALREQMADGTLMSPRMFLAGPALESPRFMSLLGIVDRVLGKPFSREIRPMRREVAAAKDASAIVKELKDQTFDLVKYRSIASSEVFHAIASAAKEFGLPLAGHEPNVVSLEEASAAGLRSLEHIPFVTFMNLPPEEKERTAATLIRNKTFITPTLLSLVKYRLTPDADVLHMIEVADDHLDFRRRYVPEQLIAFWRDQVLLKKVEVPADWVSLSRRGVEDLQRMHRAGVKILAGTDTGAPLVYPGFAIHDELQLLVTEGGMSPAEALKTATIHPAEFFEMLDSIGTIEPGKIADLVILKANPLEDIRNTQTISEVILRGVYYNQKSLQQALAGVAKDLRQ